MTYNRYDDDSYADLFDPMNHDRQARRKRKPRAHHAPKKQVEQIIDEMADFNAIEQPEAHLTYKPSLYEAGWLTESLKPFIEQALITDVLALVKGGKEANVYCCSAHPNTGVEYLAVKVYRPRQFRSLSNDALYREGRSMMGSDGKKIKENNKRAIRAVEQKSSYGALLSHTSWLMHEYRALSALNRIGINAPRPISSSDNALLIDFIGISPHEPAPTLNQVKLSRDEAQGLFEYAINAIELMLQNDMVHGDLSAYNILYHEDQLVLIDFPQVINPHINSNTYAILKRDIERVCGYFSRCGVVCSADEIMGQMWSRYLEPDPEDRAADLSRYEQDE